MPRQKKLETISAGDARNTFSEIELFGHLSGPFLAPQMTQSQAKCITKTASGSTTEVQNIAGPPLGTSSTDSASSWAGCGEVRPQRAYKNCHFCKALRPRTGQPKRRPRAPGDAPGMTQIRPRAICSALAMPSGTQRLTPAPTPDTPKDIPDAPECSRDDPGVHFGCRWIQPAPKMMPKWMSESLIFMFCRKNNKKHKTIEISIENGLPGTRKSMKIQ